MSNIPCEPGGVSLRIVRSRNPGADTARLTCCMLTGAADGEEEAREKVARNGTFREIVDSAIPRRLFEEGR